MSSTNPPKLEKDRHVRYWLRCLRTLLPTAYLGSDSTQSTFGFFIVEALALLARDDPSARLKPDEIDRIREWVLSLQRPGGGFVGNANLIVPVAPVPVRGPQRRARAVRGRWAAEDSDAGHLAGTHFALLLLSKAVRREQGEGEGEEEEEEEEGEGPSSQSSDPVGHPVFVDGLDRPAAVEILEGEHCRMLDYYARQQGARNGESCGGEEIDLAVHLGDRQDLVALQGSCFRHSNTVVTTSIARIDEAIGRMGFISTLDEDGNVKELRRASGDSADSEFRQHSLEMETVLGMAAAYRNRDLGPMRRFLEDRDNHSPNIGDVRKDAAAAEIPRWDPEAVLALITLHKNHFDDITGDIKYLRPAGRTNAFRGVDGAAILGWLRKLQQPDGSFGECLIDGQPYGGGDMRFCYMAAAVRWMLRRPEEQVPDIDVERLRTFIVRGQTYDGGFAASSRTESHAGYTFCAIAALSLLERPPDGTRVSPDQLRLEKGPLDMARLECWLVSRASYWDDELRDDVVNMPEPVLFADPETRPTQIGFNGRQNKPFDSCYTWWVCGALDMLGHLDFFDRKQCLAFLHARMQFVLAGGFGKQVGDRPDIYHSFLGLAACALLDPDGPLGSVDPALAASRNTVGVIVAARASAFFCDADSSSGGGVSTPEGSP